MNIRTVTGRHWPGIGWGIMILILTGMPGQMIPQVTGFMAMFAPDKIVHLLIFAIFLYTLCRGFIREPGFNFRKTAYISVVIAVAMGAITELLQWKVFVNRQGSIWDFIVDLAGISLGYLICRKWQKFLFN